MAMYHNHMVLVWIFVLQNLSTELTIQTWSSIVEGFNVSCATALCSKFFSTAETPPGAAAILSHHWLTFFINFTWNVIQKERCLFYSLSYSNSCLANKISFGTTCRSYFCFPWHSFIYWYQVYFFPNQTTDITDDSIHTVVQLTD